MTTGQLENRASAAGASTVLLGVRPIMRHEPKATAPTRQVVAAAIALVILGGVGAVKAGLAGADFTFDLEQARPPLANIAPACRIRTPRGSPVACSW